MTDETLSSEFDDAYSENSTELESPGTVIINNPGRITFSNDQDLVEETSEPEVYLEDLENPKEQIVVDYVNNYTGGLSRASSIPDFRNLWKLSINDTEYTVLFPDGSDLVVVDGKIYNRGSSSITGVIIDNSFSDSSYFDQTITVLPLASSSTQNTVYRYGSRVYITRYSQGASSTNLVTSVSYVQPDSVQRPSGWNITPEGLVICGLLLFSVLVSIVGGLLRR